MRGDGGKSTIYSTFGGLGLEDLSMNPVVLLEAQKIIRSMEYGQWEGIAEKALQLPPAKK